MRESITTIAKLAGPVARAIIDRAAAGDTYAQIGAELGLSERAVEAQMYRLPKKIKREAARGRLEIPRHYRLAAAGSGAS